MVEEDGAEALFRWLNDTVPDVVGPLRVSPMGAGQSNLTSLVTDGTGCSWVLRQPPPGRHDRAAHDVQREVRVLRALAGSAVPVPGVVADGSDEAGIDGPFYVMERAHGDVLSAEGDATLLSPDERLALSRDVVKVLASLHAVPPSDAGLADLGQPDGYLERQIRRTSRNWSAWGEGSGASAEWGECHARLSRRTPRQQGTVITHGDYRLSNLVVAGGKVSAVLDWELCTLGDPLADLAWLVDDWRSPEEPAIAMASPTRIGGFLDRDALVAEYAGMTGFDVTDLPYYRAFTHWKAATLLQGVVRRRRACGTGAHSGPRADELELTIKTLLDEATSLVGRLP